MVTLPAEAAYDDALVGALVSAGMDIARINCAHDSPVEWMAMVERVRQSARRANRPVHILMDLGGPKLRTGPVAGAAAVLKLKPERDVFGRVTAKGRLGLRPSGSALPVEGAAVYLSVDAQWLEHLEIGQRIELTDARARQRRLVVVQRQADGALVECDHPVAGKVRVVGPPIRLSDTPGQVRSPAPLLGQHTSQVLRERLGCTDEEISRLRRARVVG